MPARSKWARKMGFAAERIRLCLVEVVQIIMRHLKFKHIGPVAFAAVFCFLIAAGCVTTRKTPPPPPPAAQAPVRLKPGPNDGHIAYWTARLLGDHHYLQRPLDTEISGKFFDGRRTGKEPEQKFRCHRCPGREVRSRHVVLHQAL